MFLILEIRPDMTIKPASSMEKLAVGMPAKNWPVKFH
jgi:hypothetical protein